MTFREIDERMLSLIDQETGEIMDVSAFEALQMEHDKKVENMALWALDLGDEIEDIEGEIKRLRNLKQSKERTQKSLKEYMRYITHGQKIKTSLVSVSYRSNESVNITDSAAVIKWAQDNGMDSEVLKYAEPEISKTALKPMLKEGKIIPGVVLDNNISTIIK